MTMPVAIITGAANGLGWGLAQHYFDRGYQLYLVDRDETALNQRVAELCNLENFSNQKVVACHCDLTENHAVENLVKEFSQQFDQLDLLINNAGITHRSLAMQTDISVISKIMALDFLVPVELTQRLLPIMLKGRTQAKVASVINLGSMAGWMPVMGRAGYCAAKSALHQYFETLRAETVKLPLHILMAYPSFLATNIEQNALAGDGQRAQHARSTIGKIDSVESMVEKIAAAHRQRNARLFPNRLINLASILYRLWPNLYQRQMQKKFASELKATATGESN